MSLSFFAASDDARFFRTQRNHWQFHVKISIDIQRTWHSWRTARKTARRHKIQILCF